MLVSILLVNPLLVLLLGALGLPEKEGKKAETLLPSPLLLLLLDLTPLCLLLPTSGQAKRRDLPNSGKQRKTFFSRKIFITPKNTNSKHFFFFVKKYFA